MHGWLKVRRRGFTLIELLVVVAIIALLIAILIPSLSKARDRARLTVCQTRLHGWGLGFSIYCSDWDGKLPLDGGDGTASTPIGVWGDTKLWFNGVVQYMGTGNNTYDQLQQNAVASGNPFALPKGGTNSIFVCPSASEPQSDTTLTGDTVTNGFFMTTGYFAVTASGPHVDPPRPMLLCYGMNSQLRTLDYGNWQNYYTSSPGPGDISNLTQLNPSAQVPLVAEKRIRQDELPVNHPSYNKNLAQSKITSNRFSTRHNNGGNIVFADGHVEWYANAALDNPRAVKTNYYNIPGVITWNPNGP